MEDYGDCGQIRLSTEKHRETEKWDSISGRRKKPTSIANSKQKLRVWNILEW